MIHKSKIRGDVIYGWSRRVKHQDRQRIYLASELLSESVANFLEVMYPNVEKMQNLSALIRLIDLWFDVFNRLVSIAFHQLILEL